ncbi:Uncharacterised protein [Mycobacteroides abscessus subsp. abscessus]|nr:Uncharacterised protein [Mycobacteroides abscessus subsp. abscessus]
MRNRIKNGEYKHNLADYSLGGVCNEDGQI